jgi:hypothetical protein
LSSRRRRFGTGTGVAISRGNDGSFGPRPRRVLDDVGVRFGGSEHHRIGTSSSHTRPRPTRQGSRPPGSRRRRSSEHRELGSTGARQPALFGAPRARPHRDREPGALRSIGPPTPPGARQPALFGAPRARPHRDREPGALRSIGPPTSPGQGTGPLRRHGPPPHRDREPDLFGGTAPHPTGQALGQVGKAPAHGVRRRRSSEHRAYGLAGVQQTALFGAPRARLHRDREPALLGASAPHPTGTGHRTSSEATDPASAGPDLATGWAPRPLGQADGALRSTARLASRERDTALLGARRPLPPGQGTRTSSEAPATPPRLGRGPPASPRQPELFGAPRARIPGLVPRTSSEARTPPSHGTPATPPLGAGHPRRPAGRNHGVYATRLGGLAVGNGIRPRPDHQSRAGR